MQKTRDGREIIEYGVIAEHYKDNSDLVRSLIGYVCLPEHLRPEELPNRIYIDGKEYALAE